MSLNNINFGISYTTYGDNNLRDDLINPALKEAVSYKRSVGFFSTSVLNSILDGVLAIVRKNGSIQIIASPNIKAEDIEAINIGYKLREDVIKESFIRDFDEALQSLSDDNLKLTAQLIAEGVLDIKVADLNKTGVGIYHDKLGIITDKDGNSIVFVGSANETASGLENNYEKVRVFKSWEIGQKVYADEEIREFDNLWNGINPFIKTYNFSEALNTNVLIETKKRNISKSSVPVVLRDYQEEAINAWVENGYKGFFVMATGTGKTWTAIFAADRLYKTNPHLLVICAPYKHLVRQWYDDVKTVMNNAKIILVSSENPTWEDEIKEAVVKQRMNKDTRIVVISTIVSFNLQKFENCISKSKQDKFLIIDEAHRFTKRDEGLKNNYKFLLGLSATPFSGKNSAKGIELMNYFGGQVYNLPIEIALKRGFLVPYNYYPIFVNATENEEEAFRNYSHKIAGCFRNGQCVDPENLAKYLRGRLRVISMAQEKLDKLSTILSEVTEKDHLIVYCGDGKLFNDGSELRHINFVKRTLFDSGYKASQFTASENMQERMELIDTFNLGAINALAAIRCLDEGVNIPSIKGALILASNDDFREFTQRRGRILRLYKDKKCANIYDVIVLPSCESQQFATIELRRFYEYARISNNAADNLTKLDEVAAGYGLTVDDLTFNFDEIEEDTLDD